MYLVYNLLELSCLVYHKLLLETKHKTGCYDRPLPCSVCNC